VFVCVCVRKHGEWRPVLGPPLLLCKIWKFQPSLKERIPTSKIVNYVTFKNLIYSPKILCGGEGHHLSKLPVSLQYDAHSRETATEGNVSQISFSIINYRIHYKR
jgi:hypothetical protein